MTAGFLAFAFGAILLVAAVRHQKVSEVLQGATPPNDPQSASTDPALADVFASVGSTVASAGQAAAGALPGKAGSAGAQYVPGGGWGGSQAVVNIAIAIGKRHGLSVTSTKRATVYSASGLVSDHSTSAKNAYAADQSNGSSPTPQMDAAAAEIATTFGISWHGSGLANGTYTDPSGRKFRVQLIYRSMIGGNHYNHVHFGARLI